MRRRRGITASKNALHASRLPVILLSWCSALTAVRQRDVDGARALPSSPGPGVMLSTFCSELTGLLCLNEAELAARRAVEGQGAKAHAHLLLHYQKKADGYFTSELFQTHVRDVIGVMKWKECLKGKEIWLVFDNSRVHDAMCPGGLYAQHMRLNDGSKTQPDMRETTWTDKDGTVHTQIFTVPGPDGGPAVKKGALHACRERGLVASDGNPGLAECRRLLAEQPDFKAQKTAVEVILEGHDDYRVLFTPQFHPELNPIEHVWAAMKREMRARWGVDRLNKREGTGLSLDERVMNALGNVDVGTVQRYCRHSRVLAYLYQRGATGPLARFAAKWYTSHRPAATKSLLEALPL